jgi:hypothetical protein
MRLSITAARSPACWEPTNNQFFRLWKAFHNRKNSLFYKTANGAEAGDIYMSLIHTCTLCQVNPFEYLQALQIHHEEVRATAALWLPWNYRERLNPSG